MMTPSFISHCAFVSSLPVPLISRRNALHSSVFTQRPLPQPRPHPALRIPFTSISSSSSPKPHLTNTSSPTATLTLSPSSLPTTTTPPTIRFLRSFASQWRPLLPAILAGAGCSMAAAIHPLLFSRVFSVIATSTTANTPSVHSIICKRTFHIFLCHCTEAIFATIYIQLISRTAETAVRQLRHQVFSATIRNDIAFFDIAGRPAIQRAVTENLRIVRNVIWRSLGRDRGFRPIFETIFGIIVCLHTAGPLLFLIFGVFIPIITIIVVRIGVKNGLLMAADEIQEMGFLSFVSERIAGLRTIKAFGAEDYELDGIHNLLDTTRVSVKKLAANQAASDFANRFSIQLTLIALMIGGGSMVALGHLTFGAFSSLLGFCWILNFAVQGISYTLSDVSRISVALGSVYDVLDQAETYNKAQADLIDCSAAEQLKSNVRGEIKFNDVYFHYPSRPEHLVLNGISFSIKPGQMVALVGESGGGKSTIAAILSRFYSATSGTVTLDGIDIQYIPPDSYTKLLSVVDQDPFLFTGSIRSNIGYGAAQGEEQISDEEIERAARESNAHDFVSSLTHGYDTEWNPGSNLSGGQRQRVAIARSLVKQPQVLVLDEATSALDLESERAVQAALERMMHGRTTLVIAHRLSTVRKADMIMFVRDGQIIERGTYDELYARGGAFRTLVDSSEDLVKDRES